MWNKQFFRDEEKMFACRQSHWLVELSVDNREMEISSNATDSCVAATEKVEHTRRTTVDKRRKYIQLQIPENHWARISMRKFRNDEILTKMSFRLTKGFHLSTVNEIEKMSEAAIKWSSRLKAVCSMKADCNGNRKIIKRFRTRSTALATKCALFRIDYCIRKLKISIGRKSRQKKKPNRFLSFSFVLVSFSVSYLVVPFVLSRQPMKISSISIDRHPQCIFISLILFFVVMFIQYSVTFGQMAVRTDFTSAFLSLSLFLILFFVCLLCRLRVECANEWTSTLSILFLCGYSFISFDFIWLLFFFFFCFVFFNSACCSSWTCVLARGRRFELIIIL